LDKVALLFEQLNATGVAYCHWKSNLSLARSLSGGTDIDLLIDRGEAARFRAILSELGFKPGLASHGLSGPAIEHHFALDTDTGVVVHVHAYYRVITGESLAKNFRLPIEQMLLSNTRMVDSVRVPTKSAELVVFTVRMMVKHTSTIELLLLARDRHQVQTELAWLLEHGTIAEAQRLVDTWLPSLGPTLFAECVHALGSPSAWLRRIVLGRRLRSRLRLYARASGARAWLHEASVFLALFWRRLRQSPRTMVPASGGAVIAFVGAEATGKSTLVAETRRWLGEHFAVERVHAGKPRSSLLTVIPNLFTPALRALAPQYRASHIENRHRPTSSAAPARTAFPLIFAVRSVLLAYDRRKLLLRAYKRAAQGVIVLSDRYPGCGGAPDSAQLSTMPLDAERFPVRHFLSSLEKRLYAEIPPADLVISLQVPIEVALVRNQTRGKVEPEDYVRQRHARSASVEFRGTTVHRLDTGRPLDQTVLAVKRAVWDAL
jgi:thymidylate kinase